MKRLSSTLCKLFIAALTLMSPILANAENFVKDGVYYNYIKGTNNVEVTYRGSYSSTYKDEYIGDIIIPEKVTYGTTEYTVTAIGWSAFSSCKRVKSVVLPETIKEIGFSAFSMCDSLTSINLPESLETIDSNAFFYCKNLQNLHIPKNVSSINNSFIQSSDKLGNFTIDENNEHYTIVDGVLFTKDMSTLVICTGAKQGSYTIPDGVNTIYYSAFESCNKITSLTIPASVNNIQNRAFTSCYKIEEIHLQSETLPTIDAEAFNEYDAKIFVPAGSIDEYKSNAVWSKFPEIYALGTKVKGSKFVVDDITYLVTETNSKVSVTYQGVNQWSDNNYSGNIVIPSSVEIDGLTFDVTGIGAWAFSYCDKVESLSIPASVDSIGNNAFLSTKMKSIQIDAENPKYMTQNNMVLTKDKSSLLFCIPNESGKIVIPDGVTYVANDAFSNISIATLVVPESVEKFGNSQVEAIYSIEWNAINCLDTHFPFGDHGNQFTTSVTFGNKVEHIPSGLCCYMTSLTSVELPKSIKSIGTRAFMGCNGLTEITIPDGVTLMGGEIFNYCDNLSKIKWNAIDCTIDGYLFGAEFNEKITNVVFGDKVKSIPSVCYRLSNITEVKIPESVTKIGNQAFYYCGSLVKANLPKGLKEIGNEAFAGCDTLDLEFHEGLETIGTSAFSHCYSLSNVQLPSTIKSIGYHAFYACESITDIVIPEGLTFLDSGVFSQAPIKSVKWNAINCQTTQTAFPNTVETFTFGENVEYIPNNLCNNLDKITSITIPDKVKEIGVYAFNYCSGIEKINIPNSVTKIGDYAFAGTQIKEVTIPNSIQYLGDGLFSDCTALKSIALPKGISEIPNYFSKATAIESISIPESVTRIGQSAFSNCTALTEVKLNEGLTLIANYAFNNCGIKDITFPSTLRKIKSSAFYNIKVKEVVLPATIDTVEGGAFRACKNLKKVEWNITIPFNYAPPFDDCDSLDTFIFGKDVKSLGNDFISNNSKKNIKSLTILSDTFLPDFSDCTQIETLIIPNIKNITKDIVSNSNLKKLDISNAEYIAPGLLGEKSNITELILPFIGTGEKGTASEENGLLGNLFGTTSASGMKAVTQNYNNDKSKTYYISPNLAKITITEGCSEISYGALQGISTLKELTLPASLYMVGEKALYGCAGLEHIYCSGASPAACFDNSFTGVRTATCILHVPHNAADLYSRSTGWKDFYYIQSEEPITISVSQNIQNAGIVLGITEYKKGDTASLRAVANKGYRFVSWTKEGVIICDTETYEFTAEENCSIKAIFAPIANDNSIELSAEGTKVYFSWEKEEGVDIYTLNIYSDEEKQEVVKSISFDAEGNIIETRATENIHYTIDELLPETKYYYEIIGANNEGIVISQSSGWFNTLTDVYDSIDNASEEKAAIFVTNDSEQLTISGNIYGERIAIYSTNGILLQEYTAAGRELRIGISSLPRGIYIVHIKNSATRIVK